MNFVEAMVTHARPDYDVVVIGAGFGGMYAIHRLRQAGHSVYCFEAGDGVGGTWYWNRYPGARCDVESIQYSYSFDPDLEQDWDWSERYATQPEILRYADHVADRYDLRRDIDFSTRVTSVRYSDTDRLWTLQTDTGRSTTARFVVSAVGCLSDARIPEWPGLNAYRGEVLHTGRWPHEPVDFAGRRVAVIGTGSSGIQAIPVIAEQAGHLTVFQRTPNYSIPARNREFTADELREIKAGYRELRAKARKTGGGNYLNHGSASALAVSDQEREQEYERRWQIGGNGFVVCYADLFFDLDANDTAAEFVRRRIRETVRDPQVAELLTPRDHPIGSKRICVDSDYYATFNRDDVELVDVRADPIVDFTPDGLRTEGREFVFDAVVFATGYDAMTGPLLRMNVVGCGGQRLADKWSAGPRTYLGLMTAGFPNLFMLTGPGSPSVLASVIAAIEQHVDFTAELLDWMRSREDVVVEAQPDAEDAWVEHVNELAAQTIYPRANSWYLGTNVPGKPRVFMPYSGGLHTYRAECEQVAAAGYPGLAVKR
ncbi:MAG: cyclohexanone monooxygenase [Pseudonocardiales bacterium]|jgi:cyclohexanone monooxygenase|nr:cyclohexanone monooxygenase [Pseudonocardiales bacterium]